MNLALSLAFVAGAATLGTWAYLAGPEANHAVHAASNTKVELESSKVAPTQARLEERSMARWTAVARGDWISAYDFQTTEQKLVPLAQYLQGKDHHVYANPAIERVLQVGRTEAFLLVRVVWTPKHPDLQRVQLQPGESLTEEIRMVESWRWDGEDWCYVRAERTEEFFQEHPGLETR